MRTWLSLITGVLLAVILYAARHEIASAWRLLESVNLAILALLIPGQIISYAIAGEMMFAYLRYKNMTHHISSWNQTRMALEMNFVNHVLPSAGVSGISYMTWRLGHYGITPGKAALAQLVRFAAGFVAFITLLFIALVVITVDGSITRWTILFSGVAVTIMAGGMLAIMYVIARKSRYEAFTGWFVRCTNLCVSKLSFGKVNTVVKKDALLGFFEEMHGDYLTIRRDKKMLLHPYLWGLLFTIVDTSLYLITFWALGVWVNPAPLLVGYGLGILASIVFITPGGVGAVETILVSFLVISGLPAGTAIAGILLTRVILLLGTVGFGYIFYQHALLRYGKIKR